MKREMIWKAAMITAVITLGISGSVYAKKEYPSKVYHLPTVKEKAEAEEKDKEKQEKTEEEKTEPAVTPAEEKEQEPAAAPEEPGKEEQEAIDAGGEEAVQEQKNEQAVAADESEKAPADKAADEEEQPSAGKVKETSADKKDRSEELTTAGTEAPASAPKEDLTIYVWEKDENGSLVLDKDGNPIPVLKNGQEIPKEFKRDENGELILDENGDPIVTFTVPEKSILIDSIKDALDKDRSIDIYVNFGDQEKVFGATAEFVAVLHGYDRVEYKIHWQHSKDNENWEIVPGIEGNRFTIIATKENYHDRWRAKVTITGLRKDV